MADKTPWGYELSRHPDAVTVSLSGELDMAVAADVRQILLGQLERPATRTVIADLAGVGFVDSTILGVLVEVRNQAEHADRRFQVANPTPQVLRVLTITGLEEFLSVPKPQAD